MSLSLDRSILVYSCGIIIPVFSLQPSQSILTIKELIGAAKGMNKPENIYALLKIYSTPDDQVIKTVTFSPW
jgi:hypothetical protein